jgi:hypothetical protein
VALAALALVLAPEAEARPQYLKSFAKQYPALEASARKVKCGVCHYGKSKKNKNDYGAAFGGGLSGKNEKDADALIEALVGAEEKPSAVEGKTFGDRIKEGELPGTDPEE